MPLIGAEDSGVQRLDWVEIEIGWVLSRETLSGNCSFDSVRTRGPDSGSRRKYRRLASGLALSYGCQAGI